MNQLPETEKGIVVRTDFSNQAAWEAICKIIRKPVGIMRFRANVTFVDDVQYADMIKDELLQLVPDHDDAQSFIIVVDQIAISHSDNPLLIIDLFEERGREFRALPSQIQSIENNLSLANMDFAEFADTVDESGVFRGF
jgi:hypothetical protein